MKKLIVVVAAIVAACSAQKPAPESAALPGGNVVLATFTVDVDMAAGTFVVRTTPNPSAAPAGSAALVNLNADVTVSSSGTWINAATPVCKTGPSSPTWGAAVTVKNNLTGTVLSGVYAEITDFVGGTGNESCSNRTNPPTGLNTTYGLWAYGTIQPGATTSAQNWIFKYSSGTNFTFHGRIIGVRANPANVQGGNQRVVVWSNLRLNVIGDNGTTVVVATPPTGIDFVDSTTGAFLHSVATTTGVSAIAVATNRIWWGSPASGTSFVVGWMDSDGGNPSSATVTPPGVTLGSGFVHTIIPDSTSPTSKAWIIFTDNDTLTFVWSYTIGTGLGTVTSITGTSRSAALANGKIYVPMFSTNVIQPLSISTDPAGKSASIDSTTGCPTPYSIFPSGSLLYIACKNSGFVASMTDAGGFSNLGPILSPTGIVRLASGEVWAGSGEALERVEAINYSATIPGGGVVYPVTLANGYLWVTEAGYLWQIKTQ